MLRAQLESPQGCLTEKQIRQTLITGLAGQFRGQKVLTLIPDHTRSLPLPFLTRQLAEILSETRQLDFMIALGTHPALTDSQIDDLLGLDGRERRSFFHQSRFFNHDWSSPNDLVTLGQIEDEQIREVAAASWHPSLPSRIPVRINKKILEYDHILILGPTFPHEVVGFSGGAKYLFPGISGPEMIHATHWLGALAGIVKTIGIKETPVRAMIQSAAEMVPIPLHLIALAVEGSGISGIFIGDQYQAWEQAADFSSTKHIIWTEKPFKRVLSCAPAMYDELWTAAKAMYKIEPALSKGAEVVIFAPHLDVISHVHGEIISQVGYHTLPFFLEHWGHYQRYPLGILAHSTHLRGSGRMENGIEVPDFQVVLASRVPKEVCSRLNLGYLDPASVRAEDWINREAEGIMYIPKAGEILYRSRQGGTQ